MDLMRFARLMLKLQLSAMLVGAAVVFYALGLSPHPRHLALAGVLTAGYLALTGVGTTVMQRFWRARARHLGSGQPGR
jgi:hypothetical protein